MDNFQFIFISSVTLLLLFGAAAGLDYLYTDKRKACVAAGYRWSAVDYVCVANLKK